ncbi:MAG: TIGR03905 family TSCPD domain-containing protein [Oscillospiraceae bacterium]|nr:TIGR03905 family TSCPD domain-containing protein [Oscillospiraceae bacterium]
MQTYEYKPKNVCAGKITFAIDNDVITNVKFHGGCGGFSIGAANLLEGMNPKDAIKRLESVTCGNRGTSCPAQFALAVREAIGE